MLNLVSKVTQITAFQNRKPNPDTVLRTKKIPKKIIMKYNCGMINLVSVLHWFVQIQCVQLDFKETVTTGNVMGPHFALCALVNGIQYKTELGQNKKESQFNAAKFALDELLQLDGPEQGM